MVFRFVLKSGEAGDRIGGTIPVSFFWGTEVELEEAETAGVGDDNKPRCVMVDESENEDGASM